MTNLKKYPFIINKTVASSELQLPYNHVHHADILRLLEEARLALLKDLNCPWESFVEQGFFWVISSIEIKYLREIKEGDYTISCESLSFSGRNLIMSQKILNNKGKIAVEALVQQCLFSLKDKRSVVIPAHIIDKF